MRAARWLSGLGAAVLLTGVASQSWPAPAAAQSTNPATETPYPTFTPYPTATFYPTSTPYPTFTPLPATTDEAGAPGAQASATSVPAASATASPTATASATGHGGPPDGEPGPGNAAADTARGRRAKYPGGRSAVKQR